MTNRKLAFHPLHSLLSRSFARATAGVLGAAAPLMALANPTGGQVVGGSASIHNAGANGTVINQNSQNAIINWQQFNVGANQYVQFVQPNSSSVVLNRVIGGSASQIFGDIKANGQVFLVNTAGIYFAPGATLDVQGIVASTLDISDADFMAGRYTFSKSAGAPDAGVDNQGQIHVGRGGYVVLAGDYAQNQGAIDAQFGKVYLAAGSAATLTLDQQQLISYTVDSATLSRLAGVRNAGEITALGGSVVMTADVANALTATAVNNTGVISARSVRDHGGEIVLEASGGDIYNSGRLDASAAEDGVGGGTVIVHAEGGDTRLDNASLIDTSGQYAKGGFVDISGHNIAVRGFVNTGKGGNLLLDPQSIDIVPGSPGSSLHQGTGGVTNGINSIGTAFIKAQLNSGHNVAIVASNQISNTGATGITATGAGNLTIEIGTVSCPTGICTTGTPTITPGNNGTIDLTGLTVNIAGGFLASASGGQVKLGNITAASVKVNGANITAGALHATGTAATGSVSLTAADSGNRGNVSIAGGITADHGNVTIHGTGAGDSSGANITVTGAINAAGAVSISAHYIGTSVGDGGGNLQVHGVTGKTVTITALSDTNQSSGGHAGLHIAGNVKATTGDVNITDQGGNGLVVTGSISAAGNANVSAVNSGGWHNVLKTGNITAGKAVSVGLNGGGASSSGTTVKLGNVDSQRQMSFNINDTSNTGQLVVKTGTLTNHKGSASASVGSGINITLSGTNPHFQAVAITDLAKSGQSCECSAGDINVKLITTNGSNAQLKVTGAVKSSHGNVTFGSSAGHIVGAIAVNDVSGRNVGMYANVIGFGNVTAVNAVNIIDNTTASSAAITAIAGTTISARHIDVEMNASYGGTINLANLNAQNSNGPADINVVAKSLNDPVHIIVNGSINVKGKGATSGFSSAMPGIGVPVAASLNLQAGGSAASSLQAHSVLVKGNIDLTGVAGAFNFNHVPSTGPAFHATGTKGGLVVFNASASGSQGSVQLKGGTTLKGTDAELQIGATTIKTGALSVTGSGHVTHLVASGSLGSGDSKNSVGRANIFLHNGSHTSTSAATTITTGNVTVSGKGSATAMLIGQHVTAANITVSATAAKGSRSGDLFNHGLGASLPGLLGLNMESGGYNAGRAGVFIGGSNGGSTHPAQSQTINVGNVSVTGVGEADIFLAGQAIATKNLTATATKGSMHGSYFSGEAGGTGHFNIKGGEAHIGLDGSGGGNVNVAGNITTSGPTAGVDIKGSTIKVSGGVSAVGSGGTDVVDIKDAIPANAPHRHFTGPGDVTSVNIGGVSSAASVNVGGTVKVKGPGLVGVMVTGHKVTLGGLSASASAARNYTVLDTGNSINATDSFTLGDVAVLVFQGSGSAVTGPATVNGNVNLSAPHGNVYLGTSLNVKGQFAVNANGDVTTDVQGIAPRFNEIGHAIGHSNSGQGVPSSFSLPLRLNAAGVSMIAGGSIDLTGATLTTPTSGVAALKAGGDIVLSGVDITVGSFVAYAGGTIHNGGTVGTISAGAVAFHAGKDLTLSSTDITVGTGVVPQDATTVNGNPALKAILADTAFAATLAGDPQLLAGFAAGGIPATSLAPNAAFIGGGAVSLGGLTLKGGYLYLQGTSVALGSAVTAPKGVVVQVAPATPAGTIDLEGRGAGGANLNLNDTGFLDQFGDGTTLVLGASGSTGAIFLGNNGSFDIGSDNLILDTTGTVTGLGNVTSTGIVSSLEALLADLVVPPTSGEIDPTSANNNNAAGDKKHENHGDESAGAEGTQGGTISQDTSASAACH